MLAILLKTNSLINIFWGLSPQMNCKTAFCRTTAYVEHVSMAAPMLFILHFSPLRAVVEKGVFKVCAKSVKNKCEEAHFLQSWRLLKVYKVEDIKPF